MTIHYQETTHGFEYGDAKVERIFSSEKKGWVTIGVVSTKHPRGIQIYITKTGKIRVHSDMGEWLPVERKIQ